jgi:hypothetical protein
MEDDSHIGLRGLGYFIVVTMLMLIPPSTSTLTAQPAPQQQTNESQTQNAARKQSTVRGRVIYDDTRRPLRRVQVTIYDPAAKINSRYLVAWTDGRGDFQIKEVPTGKYFVVVTAPGIVRSGADDSDESQRDHTSVTVDGTSRPDVVIRVKRGGAISGKVTYADGDPAVNASIRILRKKDGKWTPVNLWTGSEGRVLTDERGVYRVSGLAPGEYLVGAAEERRGLELYARDDPDGATLLNRALLMPTYYDGATNLAGATPLTIQAGSEETNINITLADRPVHSISGLVTLKGDNHPIARARISLKRKGDDLPSVSDWEQPVTNTDVQGRFTFDEVQDGSYTITIAPANVREDRSQSPSQAAADISQRFVEKALEVNLAGADLADLNIQVSSGSRISGIVEVEGGKTMPANVAVYAAGTQGRVQPDGTFTIDGVPSGSVFLRTSVPPYNKYYTKSVTLGKTELQRGPLIVKEDEDITNVRIVISPDVAVLSGRALAADGKSPLSGVSVVLVSTEPDQHKLYGYTNADGSFRVSGAPGEYQAIVIRPGENPYSLSNDALRSRLVNAQRIVLQPGENNAVDVVAPSDK